LVFSGDELIALSRSLTFIFLMFGIFLTPFLLSYGTKPDNSVSGFVKCFTT
jgi:hypothetical protein